MATMNQQVVAVLEMSLQSAEDQLLLRKQLAAALEAMKMVDVGFETRYQRCLEKAEEQPAFVALEEALRRFRETLQRMRGDLDLP